MPLKADLPDHLYWLTEKVEGLLRPAAYLVDSEPRGKSGKAPSHALPLGATFTGMRPDVPVGAPWADLALRGRWDESPYDGESFMMQLNLEDIPLEVRQHLPLIPSHGVVWVTIDLSPDSGWVGTAYFDPRAASSIVWHPRKESTSPWPQKFVLQDTLTCCTDVSLPEIASDWRSGGLAHDYDNWWQDHYAGRSLSDVQVGGWLHPIQGDCDESRKTLVMAIEDQGFGDSGAVYLHYSAEDGFFVHVMTH